MAKHPSNYRPHHYSTREFIAAVGRFNDIPRRELIKALRELRESFNASLGCTLNAPTFALVNELKEQAWAINAPDSYMEEWLLTFLPLIPESEAKKDVFNAHIRMWAHLATCREILIGIVKLDFPSDYRPEIQKLSRKIESFIGFCIGYRFHSWMNEKITDDIETAKDLNRNGDYDIAKRFLEYPWQSFYVVGLDDDFAPYFKACKDLIAQLV